MATLVLGAVGTAIGGPVGGYIGAMAGSYIDNKYIMPAIFGTQKQEFHGPRINDLALQMATEGSPIRKLYGPENRVSGVAIWLPDLIEVKKSTSAGGGKGGGGGGQEITNYSYFADLAVALCEGEIVGVNKIWADAKLLYDAAPDISLAPQTNLSVTLYITYKWYYPTDTEVIDQIRMDINSPNGGVDLSQFRSGRDIVVSGFSNAANNGTFRCILSSLDEGTGESMVRLKNSDAVIEAAGASVTLSQDLPTHNPKELNDLTVHLGTDAQTQDALITSYEGVTATPGFRRTAYCVLNRLALKNYGNRIPILSFLVEADASKTIAATIENALSRAGLTADEYDTTALSGNVRGYVVTSPQPAGNIIEPLLVAYDIEVQETNGKLYFTPQEDMPVYTVPDDDLGAYEDGGAPPVNPAEITDPMEKDLPAEVNVKFIEADNDYQPGNQGEPIEDNPNGTVDLLEVPVTMDAVDARAIAARTAWRRYGRRRAIRLSLPPSYSWIKANERLSITVEGETLTVIAHQVDRGRNFLVQVEGSIEEIDTGNFDEVAVAEAAYTKPGSLAIPYSGEQFFQVVDVAPLRDQDATVPGYYAAIAPEDINTNFYGAVIWDSLDGVTYYELDPAMQLASTMGRTIGAAIGDADAHYPDLVNTVNILMTYGTLESKTIPEIMSGDNMALLGNEILAFRSASLIGTNLYQLSYFLRGLRGTEYETGRHANPERFLLLSNSALVFQSIPFAQIGIDRSFKAVPAEFDLDDVDPQTETINANTIRPFGPSPVWGERDVSDNLTISWERRSRAITSPFSAVIPPLLESSERYEIDIYDGATVVRTIDGLGASRTASYTAAQQTADGLTPGDPVTLKIYQMSDTIGRGREMEATI